jgi:hypothetical protein
MKIRVRLPVPLTTAIETVWATPVAPGAAFAVLDNIPAMTGVAACGDVVRIGPVAGREADWLETVSRHEDGHALLVFKPTSRETQLRALLSLTANGCRVERMTATLVALMVPKRAERTVVRMRRAWPDAVERVEWFRRPSASSPDD